MIHVHRSFLLRGPHNSLFGANQYHFRFPMILYSKQSLNVLTQTEKPHDISDNHCNNEMRKGFLFTSKDGAFSFADEVPGVFHNAKKAEGFIEITPLEASHRVSVEAYCCEACRLVQFTY